MPGDVVVHHDRVGFDVPLPASQVFGAAADAEPTRRAEQQGMVELVAAVAEAFDRKRSRLHGDLESWEHPALRRFGLALRQHPVLLPQRVGQNRPAADGASQTETVLSLAFCMLRPAAHCPIASSAVERGRSCTAIAPWEGCDHCPSVLVHRCCNCLCVGSELLGGQDLAVGAATRRRS
jgi:hypothetical protein